MNTTQANVWLWNQDYIAQPPLKVLTEAAHWHEYATICPNSPDIIQPRRIASNAGNPVQLFVTVSRRYDNAAHQYRRLNRPDQHHLQQKGLGEAGTINRFELQPTQAESQ